MPLQLTDLEGTWYINQSNFPMWLKGDKTKPTFHYSIQTKGQQEGLKDVVSYYQKGRIKQIKGFDTVLKEDNSQFLWRGKGLLALVTSQWGIAHLAPSKDWAIIYFKKTWFTPAGYDVISRYPQLSTAQFEAVEQQVQQLSIVPSLTTLQQ